MTAPSTSPLDTAEFVYPRAEAPQPQTTSLLLILVCALLIPGLLAYNLVTNREAQVVAEVLAVLGVAAIFAWPFVGVVLLIGLVYVRPEESIVALQGMRLTLMVSLVTLLALWVHAFVDRKPMTKSPVNPLILGFGAIAIFTTFGRGTTSLLAPDMTKLVVLVFLVLNLVRTRQRYQAYVTSLVLFTSYLGAYSTYLYYTGRAMKYTGVLDRSIATGIFEDPNGLSAALVCGLALALGRVRWNRRASSVMYLALSALLTWSILLTNSRGGLLALMVVVGGYFLMAFRRKTVAVAVAVVMLGGLLAFAPSRMREFDSNEESANSRFWFWDNALQQLASHPLLGVGYGEFPDVNDGMTAHNSFVLCFAELGLVGYFCWMGCLYFCFRKAPREEGAPTEDEDDRRDLYSARLALAAYLMACFWISRTYNPILYLMMSLPIAQQVSSSGGTVHFPMDSTARFRHLSNVLMLSLGSIAFVWVLVQRFK
ncbi:MAG TPA: O-antigen ligase family protein [Armatimonadota bacterium]|jgi:O-antigen ligase